MSDPALRVLQDRAAVRDVLDRYASGVDRRDFQAVERCFAPDVRGRFGGIEHADRDALLAFIRGVSHFTATLHWIGPARVALGEDGALATAPALIAHRLVRPDGSLFRYDSNEMLYTEALARQDGGFWIERRDAAQVEGGQGVRGLASADPAVARLLDLAAVDDATIRFGLAQERAAEQSGRADSVTCLLGHPIVALAGEGADVQVTALEIARSGRLDPGPTARPWTPRWQREETRCLDWRLGLARRDDGLFEVAHANGCEALDASARADGALPQGSPWPRSGDSVVAELLARAELRDLVARRTRQEDLAGATGLRRLLGNQRVTDDGSGVRRVESDCFELRSGQRWGDGACRLADEIRRRDGTFEIVSRQVLPIASSTRSSA